MSFHSFFLVEGWYLPWEPLPKDSENRIAMVEIQPVLIMTETVPALHSIELMPPEVPP